MKRNVLFGGKLQKIVIFWGMKTKKKEEKVEINMIMSNILYNC